VLSSWDIANVGSKWLIYLGVSAVIGGLFMLFMVQRESLRQKTAHYVGLGSLLGILAVSVNFCIQLGAIADDGVSGMFDPLFGNILWQSTVGDSLLWRVPAFVICLLAAMITLRQPSELRNSIKSTLSGLFAVSAAAMLAYSFSTIGHSANVGALGKWLLGFHVLAFAWWMGALYPLYSACSLLEVQPLRKLMHQFGQIALAVVGLLIICGILLLSKFFASPMELFTTPYGQLMSAKLIAVSGILSIAALHKLRFVPNLTDLVQTDKLKKSIAVEMLLGGSYPGYSSYSIDLGWAN